MARNAQNFHIYRKLCYPPPTLPIISDAVSFLFSTSRALYFSPDHIRGHKFPVQRHDAGSKVILDPLSTNSRPDCILHVRQR